VAVGDMLSQRHPTALHRSTCPIGPLGSTNLLAAYHPNRTFIFPHNNIRMSQVPQSAQGSDTSTAAAQCTQALPLLVGLTGSIGMGKSTVSSFVSAANVPVLSADDVVHQLYAAGGAAVAPVGAAFPDAVVAGAIDRAQLSKYVVGKETAMKQLEAIVHPLVEAERLKFVQQVCNPCLTLSGLGQPHTPGSRSDTRPPTTLQVLLATQPARFHLNMSALPLQCTR
jgi:hypothetical protein